MVLSIMLTSCGKLAGLSNSDKKAGNKSPVPSPSSKPQPQKDNETVNKTPAINTSPKLIQPIKIYNDDIEQSWESYAYDHMFEIGLILSVIVVSSVLAVKKVNPFEVLRKCYETSKEYFKNKFKPKNQPKMNLRSEEIEPELKLIEVLEEEEDQPEVRGSHKPPQLMFYDLSSSSEEGNQLKVDD
jgi:hypothetical protein